MRRIKITAGIIWALVCLVLIIILFPGLSGFSKSVSTLPFMKINPRYTGGEVAYQTISKNCTLVVRKPVFTGLFRERNDGFVQVDWRGKIPDEIKDTVDYGSDGKADFRIMINSKNLKTILEPLNDKVKDLNISTATSYGWCVRVNLMKKLK
jgi:hypothetical protein